VITALAVSRGPYDPITSSLFIADQTGHLYRLDDPANTASSTIPVDITGGSFPTGYIKSIAVNPRNDDTVLVTYSSYGVTSIFWTGNANASTPTWVDVERNLTLPSIRSSAIAIVGKSVEYFVGTEVGLFRSSDPHTTDWTAEGVPEMGLALANNLALRPSDNRLLVGTYGNGMWTTTLEAVTATLPLTLIDFKGKKENDNVVLQWRTASENNTDRFEVERSPDAINFLRIASVAAAGNSSMIQYYQHADKQAMTGENYYRLKMFDKDGRFTYSSTVMIELSTKPQIVVSNSFSNQITIRFSKPPSGIVHITLVDISGKIITSRMFKTEQQIQLDISNMHLAKGVYLLRIETGNEKFIRKLVKQ
jgi:hypothetical protein